MEQIKMYDITPLRSRLLKLYSDSEQGATDETASEEARERFAMRASAFRESLRELNRLKPARIDYGVWRRPSNGAHQVFCPRCDGKESTDRPFCPRCGLNMRPPNKEDATYV